MAMVIIKMRSPALTGRGWDEETFTGEIVPNFKWLSDARVCLTTGNPSFPVRVLEKRWITSVDGVETSPPPPKRAGVRRVAGSRGDVYTVSTDEEGVATCTCKGFVYRRSCRHVSECGDAQR